MKTLLSLSLLLSVLTAAGQTTASYISKGNEYYLRLQFEAAEGQYRKALEKAPNNSEARYNLGNALMQQKKFKAAVEMYEGVTTENKPLKTAAHYNAGVSYTRQKDLASSIEAYKSALRISPNDKEARENLQKALFEQKQQQQNQQNNKGGGGGMSQKDADKKLKDLREKEKELQKKMQLGKDQGAGGGKDW